MNNSASTNFLAPSFFKNLETVNPQNCFELFMGKKHGSNTENEIDKVVYKFLMDAASQKVDQKNKIHVIKHFHPENLQKLLAIAHDLALQNNQPEKALEFKKQLEEIRKAKNLTSLSVANFSFDNQIENAKDHKSYITIFKVLGASLLVLGFAGLGFWLKNSLVDPLNPLNPNPSGLPDLTKISVYSYNGVEYSCEVTSDCIKNLPECKSDLKRQLHTGYGTQQMENGTTREIIWSTVPKNCIRV